MEQPEFELVPIWDAGAAGEGLTYYATVPAPKYSKYLPTQKSMVGAVVPTNGHVRVFPERAMAEVMG